MKIKRVWLITRESDSNCDQNKQKFVAILNSRRSENSVKQILEQYYISDFLSFREQFSFIRSKKYCPYKIQNNTISVSERSQKEFSVPPLIPFTESLHIGDNPYLWARIVFDLETWIDETGLECLKWKEQENISWDGGKIKSDWRECSLKRQ